VQGADTVIAIPAFPEPEPFQTVKVRLSLLLPLQELDQPYPKQKLLDELKHDEVVRIDLFCRDSVRGVELFQAALKAKGHQLHVDATALDRVKKKVRGEFMLYTESMTAEEIAQLLEKLGSDDKKLETKKAGEGLFDKFMLAPFLPDDLKELAKLLGIPASEVKLPKKVSGLIDPRKSLENITAQQLVQSLPKSGSRNSEKSTLITPYGVANFNANTSKEIKSFLDKRGDRKPNTLPMMLVLRPIG